MLCETCQRCLRDHLILKVRGGTHHATASSMLAAVEIGCRVCTCLWRQYSGDRRIDPQDVSKDLNGRMPFSGFWSYPNLRFLGFHFSGSSAPLWYLEPSAIRNEMVPRIDLSSYQNDRISLMKQYWKLAKGWLSECSSHHTRCKHVTSVENYYPTRLIDVRANGSDCKLRLYSTINRPIKEPYMTLSHCWGNSQFLRLTNSTSDRLQRGFALAELPPTFQDAILVTRVLGINFLWIDALCIIQDSIVDWQHEATLMSQVYSNSTCNISALGAQDSTVGLFFDRETLDMPYCTFKTCRKFKRKQVYDIEYTDLWSDSVQHAPLTRRAWVLQERLLAPRVLHFGKKQLLWECNELRACEVYPRGMRATDIFGDDSYSDKYLKKSFTAILQRGPDNALTSSQMREAWRDLVQHYTKCNLTMSADKLVAISGIVKRLQPLFNTDYLAGLWRDNLLEQMLWYVDSYDGERRFLAEEKRPEYRAPSWSWASINAPIVPPLLYSEKHHMATIIEAHVTPVTDDITGQIKGGYIHLRAPLFPVQVDISINKYLSLSWDWEQMETRYMIDDRIKPDVWPQSAVEGLQFVPLLMTSYSPRGKEFTLCIYGLMLQPVEEKQGVYQRWGYVRKYGLRVRENERKVLNFGVQLIKGKWTYTPPERYPEQTITLI